MSEDDVVGHGPLLQRLVNAAQANLLGHALLLVGPEGVGKTTVALHFAARMLDIRGWPGEVDTHPDLWLEDGDSENVSVERVRSGGREPLTLQDFLALRPYGDGPRVAILARADRLTEPAANTLLKSIEEPPPGTYVVLAAAHPEKLPLTVQSRCETFMVAPVAATTVADWLGRRTELPPGDAQVCARLAMGRPGHALELAREPELLRREIAAADAILAAGGGGVRGALQAASEVAPPGGAEGRERGLVILNAWASLVRDVACIAAGAPELVVWTSRRSVLERWADELPLAVTVDLLQRLVTASEALATYSQPRLTFDALLIDIFGGATSPPAPGPDFQRATEGQRPSGAVRPAGGRRRRQPAATGAAPS